MSLTPLDKAALLSGADEWTSRGDMRAGVIPFRMSDGPHGVRRQLLGWGEQARRRDRADRTGMGGDNLGLGESLPATCFPTATAVADTWDPALAEAMGRALGEEARAQDVQVLLGPGLNIKRSPLCGRNFEYYSEDPLLAGRMAAGLVRGIQGEGVAACPKHFAVNSQELRRQASNAVVDERTLREIYLTAFEIVVREARPWALMSSYNQVNGVYAHENRHLLMDILRGEWGFDGAVISDWGGSNSAVAAARAGGSLEMPSPGFTSARAIVGALRAGRLSMADVDARVAEVARLSARVHGLDVGPSSSPSMSAAMIDAHHALARRIAEESAVLLKNETVRMRRRQPGDDTGDAAGEAAVHACAGRIAGTDAHAAATEPSTNATTNANPIEAATIDAQPRPALPLAAGARIAVIGDMARVPRYQGSGSSKVNATREENLLDALRAEDGITVVGYARGYERHDGAASADGSADGRDEGANHADERGRIAALHHWCHHATAAADAADGDASRRHAARAAVPSDGSHHARADAHARALADEAAALAARDDVDAVVVVAGLDERSEAEGLDRSTMAMPRPQNELIETLAAVCRPAGKPMVVVLVAGSPVELPWIDHADAVLYVALAGQAGASAVARLLTGRANPSGHLAETWPLRLSDTPTADWYPAVHRNAIHREGPFVGYRYYATAGVPVRFPFGHGLSYSRFVYSGLRVDDGGATFTVTNASDAPGATVAQLYVRAPRAGTGDSGAIAGAGDAPACAPLATAPLSAAPRAVRELKGFAKVRLDAHESREVCIPFDRYTFRHYGVGGAGAARGDGTGWQVTTGEWAVMIGRSADDIALATTHHVDGTVSSGAAPADPRLGAYLSGRVKDATDVELCALFGVDGGADAGKGADGFGEGPSVGGKLATLPPLPGIYPDEPAAFGPNDPILDWVGSPSPVARAIARHLIKRAIRTRELHGEPDLDALFKLNMPPRVAVKLAGGMVDVRMVEGMVDIANGRSLRGLWRIGTGLLRNLVANAVASRRLRR